MILYIDTTDNEVAEIAVISDEKKINEHWQDMPPSEEFPQAIKRFLKTHGIKLSDISKIAVKVGPGFFSRVRTGVVAANSMAFALKVKVVAVVGLFDISKVMKNPGKNLVAPRYGAGPNITVAKKRV
jgi:tRNA A37 threonylcarbamoyladenosine modification protein TsaB